MCNIISATGKKTKKTKNNPYQNNNIVLGYVSKTEANGCSYCTCNPGQTDVWWIKITVYAGQLVLVHVFLSHHTMFAHIAVKVQTNIDIWPNLTQISAQVGLNERQNAYTKPHIISPLDKQQRVLVLSCHNAHVQRSSSYSIWFICTSGHSDAAGL